MVICATMVWTRAGGSLAELVGGGKAGTNNWFLGTVSVMVRSSLQVIIAR